MIEREEAVARGGEDLTPPNYSLADAPRELVRELMESGIPDSTIKAVTDTRPPGVDKRLTAPLAIRSRRARIAVVELYAWVHHGRTVEDVINELNYLTGISPRTLREYWDGIKMKGRVRQNLDGRVARLDT